MLVTVLTIGSGLLLGSAVMRTKTKKLKQRPAALRLTHNAVKSPKKNVIEVRKPVELSSPEKRKANHYLRVSFLTLALHGMSYKYLFVKPLVHLSIAYLCVPILKKAVAEWSEERRLGHHFLHSALVVLSFISGQVSALLISLFFVHLGRKLLLNTQNQSRHMLTDLFTQTSETTWLLQDGAEVEVDCECLKKDDLIVLNSGDLVPVDGIIESGTVQIDQKNLTGESMPAEKTVQDEVLASTRVVSGRVVVRVCRTGEDTAASKISQVLNSSTDFKLSLLSNGEKWSDKIASPLMMTSVLGAPFVGLAGVTAILNSTFGSRMHLIAPLCVLNHLNQATEQGILVKDGRALEQLTKIDTIVFDKTGTLTEELPEVGAIQSYVDTYTPDQVLAELAAAENNITHPIARAVVSKAQDKQLELPEISELDFQVGSGLTVTINAQQLSAGSPRFIQSQNIPFTEQLQTDIDHAYEQGHSVILLANQQQVIGSLEIVSRVRPEVMSVISQLRELGLKKLFILSGDHEKPTQALARQLSFDGFYAGVMPENKAVIINELKAQGHKVCFVGDGVNDALAMRAADVSVSLESASSVARDLAQVVLMSDSLERMPNLFQLAHSLESSLKGTLGVLYSTTLVNLVGAFFFSFNLLTTVLINNLTVMIALKQTQNKQRPMMLNQPTKVLEEPKVISL